VLVSTIITNAMSKADISNQNFYPQNDQLFDAQLCYNEMYELMAENDDDYFVTQVYLTPGTDFTSDANRESVFIYTLPDDFFRLRMLSYHAQGGGYFLPCYKMDVNNFGNTQSSPGYRLVGSTIEIYDPFGMDQYAFWYYPSAQQLEVSTELVFPHNAMYEYIVWRMAEYIKRKQNQDSSKQQEVADRIMQTMKKQSRRDDFRAQAPKDIFSDGNQWWQ